MTRPKRLSAVHAAETRAELLRVARELFAERGYHGTSIDEIVERSRTSKGALYHHFRSKEELFRSVVDEVVAGLMGQLNSRDLQRQRRGDPRQFWGSLPTQQIAYLVAASADSTFRQVVLIDGPAVLGWTTWREIQETLFVEPVRAWFSASIDHGLIKPHPVAVLARLYLAAMNEAVMMIAHSDDPDATRRELNPVLIAMLEGLLVTRAIPETVS
jgi:AcrR family transcriptional regulator